jgi:hypothetical protein
LLMLYINIRAARFACGALKIRVGTNWWGLLEQRGGRGMGVKSVREALRFQVLITLTWPLHEWEESGAILVT